MPNAPTVLVPKLREAPGAKVISPVSPCLNLITQSSQVERVIRPCLPMLRDFLDGNRFKSKRNFYVSCIIRRTCHDQALSLTIF